MSAQKCNLNSLQKPCSDICMAQSSEQKSQIPDDLLLCIGHRIAVEKFKGTIRYVGPVATSKKATTTWLGIEWDDANRGKNDGSVKSADGQIHRYFTTEEGRGSFIKPAKANFGRDLLTAILDRFSLAVTFFIFHSFKYQAMQIKSGD